MENKICECGGVMVYKSGTSKAGKPYAGYFCQENKEHVEWISTQKPAKAPARPYVPKALPNEPKPNWDAINARKEEGMEWLNAKNNAAVIVAALIKAGHLDAENYYERFQSITESIFGFQETRE